jgi:putative membrane protein
MFFTDDQARRIQELADRIERRTGVEILAAVVGKSDVYPEIPWKAFALGVSAAALLLSIRTIAQPEWVTASGALLPAFFLLATGSAAALLSVFWPTIGRLFLDGTRAETETMQYARSLFLEREIFRARDRNGILLLVSLFERKVVLLPDTGAAGRLDPQALQDLVARMGALLRRGDRCPALLEGLAVLEEALIRAGFAAAAGTEDRIPEELIQQRGEDR